MSESPPAVESDREARRVRRRNGLHEGWARMEALWSAALPLLRQQGGDRNFTAGIEPIRYHGANGEVRLEVPSRFFQAWVTRHFLPTIRDTVSQLSGAPCTVRITVGPDNAPERRE